jgi:maltose alpha-D-glucosyltransferase/alpha-amylase
MIGQRLGEMHAVLAQPSDDPAFAPKEASAEDAGSWIARAEGLLSRAFDAIRAHKNWDDESSSAEAKRLLSQEELLTSAMRRRAKTGIGSVMTRIHGDFHLGQVLVASGDVHIIDFEGEPARPLKERRAKASPLRDVAGLLRSLDYAAATLVPKNVAAAAPLPDEARREFITRLRDGARDAFISAYRAATEALPGLANADLLDFFLIEKAAYEVSYEAANRPAWVPIPMHGLANLAGRIVGKSLRRPQ